jgi:hypothetical protein
MELTHSKAGVQATLKMRSAEYVARIGRSSYRVSVGIPGGKGPSTRPGPTWDDDSNMDLTEIRWKAWSEFNYLTIRTVGALL